jgi:hypothetical protein
VIGAVEGLLLLPGAVYAAVVWRLGSDLARLPDPAGSGSGNPWPAAAPPELPAGIRRGVTVIVAARNEAAALPATLAALLAQDLPAEAWQLRLVDDGSTDDTAAVAAHWTALARSRGLDWALVTGPVPGGKKRALCAGLAAGDREWAAVLDADCRPAPGWLRALAAAAGPRTGLVAAPAIFTGAGCFAALVRLEYAGWLGAGLASFARGEPLYASGANLAWRRVAFEQAGGYTGLEDVPSADDTLLIQRIRRRTNWEVRATLAPQAIVPTRGPATLRAFWRQRVRWTSGEKAFESRSLLAAALGLYLVFLLAAGLPLAALAGWAPSWLGLGALLLKAGPDLRLAARAARRLGLGRLLPLLPLVWLLQLGYGLVVPWFGTFGALRWRETA